jgi:lipid II:glycine glycyltransferase (peptidoglycan interpeptide bridge formation enzyme)
MTTEQPTLNSLAVSIKGDVDALTQILLNANDENESLKADLAQTSEQLRQAQIQSEDLQTQINAQTAALNEANKNLNAALAQSAVDRRNAHKFKGIIMGIAVLAVAAVLFGIFGYKVFAPPLLWILIGAPTAVGIFLFFWLG